MTLPVLPAASSLTPVQVSEFGRQLIEWSRSVDDVAEVRDAAHKWAGITEYLRRQSREGVAQAEATLRRLEARVGELMPPEQGRRTDLELPDRDQEVDLDGRQLADFREMAANPDIVERVIAESTDDNPPSRRKVIAAIKEPIGADKSRSAVAARRNEIRRLAASGNTAAQIAPHVGMTPASVKNAARDAGIDLVADRLLGKQRRIDPGQVIENMIAELDSIVDCLPLIGDISSLDADQLAEWRDALRKALRSISGFVNKEMNP